MSLRKLALSSALVPVAQVSAVTAYNVDAAVALLQPSAADSKALGHQAVAAAVAAGSGRDAETVAAVCGGYWKLDNHIFYVASTNEFHARDVQWAKDAFGEGNGKLIQFQGQDFLMTP